MVLLSVAFGMLSQHALAQTNLLDRTLVIEYHNSVLDHYFLSTPTEAVDHRCRRRGARLAAHG